MVKNGIGIADIISFWSKDGFFDVDLYLRFCELKKLRENLYLQCVPILKQLIGINQNIEGVRTLMNIFGTLGDNQGYMEMKNLLDQLDQ